MFDLHQYAVDVILRRRPDPRLSAFLPEIPDERLVEMRQAAIDYSRNAVPQTQAFSMSGDDILGYQFPDRGNLNNPDFDVPIVDFKSTDDVVVTSQETGNIFADDRLRTDTCRRFLHGVSTETIQSGNLGSVVQEWLTVNGIKQSKAIRLAAGELTKAVKEMK